MGSSRQFVFLGYNKTRQLGQWKTGGRVRQRLHRRHPSLALPCYWAAPWAGDGVAALALRTPHMQAFSASGPSALLFQAWLPIFLSLPHRMSKQDQLGQSVWKGVGEMPRLCHVMPGAEIFPPFPYLWVRTLSEEAGVWPVPPTCGPWVIHPSHLSQASAEGTAVVLGAWNTLRTDLLLPLENNPIQLERHCINAQEKVTRLRSCSNSRWLLFRINERLNRALG